MLMSKTAKACRSALQKKIEAIKNGSPNLQLPFWRKIKSQVTVPKQSEKTWEDKGPKFASGFPEFCQASNIPLYSTNRETKPAFEERNIRSLKSTIFKYVVHSNSADVYIDNLQKFVNVINSRVNRVPKLAPNLVRNRDVSFVVSLQNCNAL